jgi:Ca2+-binding RTX toxin-like protein
MRPASGSGLTSRSWTIAVPLVMAALVWSLPSSSAVDNSASCSFSPPEVQIINSGPSTTVSRSVDDILVDGATCGPGGVIGIATVTNTGLIHFYDNFGGYQSVKISLAGGPFAPGLDTGASAEIDFTYTSTSLCDQFWIVGTPGVDYITWGGGLDAAANLNADETEGVDADLTVLGCAWGGASGGGGNDLLSAAGGAGTGNPARYLMRLIGGTGDDVMIGGSGPDHQKGGRGADRLIGGPRSDPDLRGGPGPDVIRGGPGSDDLLGEGKRDLLVGGDGNDVLKGGAGFDTCKGGPGKDKYFTCEKIID